MRPRGFGFGLGYAQGFAFARHGNRTLLLGQLQRFAALDLGTLDRTLFADALLFDALFAANARRVDGLPGADLRAFGVLLALRTFGGQLGALARARDLDLALLVQPRVLGLAVDVQAQLPASRFLLRIAISVSCSTSLRCFLRCSICSVRRVRPSASKALLGLKYSMPSGRAV